MNFNITLEAKETTYTSHELLNRSITELVNNYDYQNLIQLLKSVEVAVENINDFFDLAEGENITCGGNSTHIWIHCNRIAKRLIIITEAN